MGREQLTPLTKEQKEYYMSEAIKEAERAKFIGEVPIGAVVVMAGEIIARGYNLREATQDATTHAEILAIRRACHKTNSWRLEGARLFVTLEPCPMCAGAMLLSRVDEVYYGASDPKGGAAGTLLNLLTDSRFNHEAYVEKGILGAECGELLTAFFRDLRAQKKAARRTNVHGSK